MRKNFEKGKKLSQEERNKKSRTDKVEAERERERE